ncbi:MAG: riboflavin synthase [Candidatus Omnitrophica bacterium]|nr:riboflavin synthase [Candidatus Omnitrophota bacterium]MDD5574394.1 riboflavin synthase [Candidatus Omnitrophota bacterium]
MFTGIIEEIGTILCVQRRAGCSRLVIEAESVCRDVKIGESVSVDGVCLTVVEADARRLFFDVMPQTLGMSTLRSARPGVRVNLERAVKADSRFGGHLVSGHVDGTGVIRLKKTSGGQKTLSIAVAPALLKYIFLRGSIAVDGISLTVSDKRRGCFSVCLIPHTAQATTLGKKTAGCRVNIEADMIARMSLDSGKKGS